MGETIRSDTLNICLVPPAFMPEWAWLPVAHEIEELGHQQGVKVNTVVPDLPRENVNANVRDDVNAIANVVDGLDRIYFATWSRGFHSTVFYLDRLSRRKNGLANILGVTVMNTVGLLSDSNGKAAASRHNPDYAAGVSINDDGYEIVDPQAAEKYLLHDISDDWLRNYVANNLIAQRPHGRAEKAKKFRLPTGLITLKWLVCNQDKVDNLELSAEVAREEYDVEPIYKEDWGHVAPLTHTNEVAKEILGDAVRSNARKSRGIRRFMQEAEEDGSNDRPDSYVYVKMRRVINEKFPEQPVDFNVEGLKVARLLAGSRPISSRDFYADIGSGSCEYIAEAAEKIGFEGHILGIEPDSANQEWYSRMPDSKKQRVAFVEGYGEAINLPTNSVRGVTAHNVIFRAYDVLAMLKEMQRIVEPGGFIAISTNAEGHAKKRHQFERQITQAVMDLTGLEFNFPDPAFGYYLEDLPELIEQVPGLEIIDLTDKGIKQIQDTKAIITPDRIDEYIYAIFTSASRTPLEPHQHVLWRQETRRIVNQAINESLATKPYFTDDIRRGMVVVINKE